MGERKIETLEGGEHIRIRHSMYLDADPEVALRLAVRELWVNGCDELTFRHRKGNVKISINPTERTITVSDDGDGIPVKSLVDAYLTVNTGSNFFDREGSLVGAMGVGSKAVSHTAERVLVTSINSGEQGEMEIIFGETQGELKGDVKVTKAAKGKRGVTTVFSPSRQVYGDAWIDEQKLLAEIDEAAKFYPDITFTIKGAEVNKTISYPKGLYLKNTVAYYGSENVIISLCLEPGEIKPFGNRLYLKDGGAFNTHFKTQLTRSINDSISFKISGSEIQAALSGYVAVFVRDPVFSNQQKSAIGNKECNPEITLAVKNLVEQLQGSSSWQRFIQTLETEMKAEEAAEKARKRVKNALSKIEKGAKSKVVVGDKLKDCIDRGEKAWLAICEGLSAKGSLALGRDINSIALYDIRGKFINVLKNKQEDYLDNEELIQICQILGCGIFEKYNAKKLKYGKVLISVDADEDGKNIADLLITFFAVCMPQFIKEGRLYWMKTPLYYKGDQFIFTEADWEKVKNKRGFTRAKGLGELEPAVVEKALFGEAKQWVQIKPKNWKEFERLVNTLMGPDVEERRDFIFQNVDFERIKFL